MHCPTLFSVVRCALRLGVFFAWVVLVPGVLGESTSEERIDRLRQLALEAFDAQGADAADEVIREAVLAEFATECEAPVPPERVVVTSEMCREKMQAMLQRKAKEKFPMADEDELAEEAANQYPIHQVGDRVSISFRPNPVRTVKAAGVYQGRNEKFLKIGSRSILIRDVRSVPGNEDELLKFFPDQSQEKRRQYIARRKAEVFARRDQWRKEHRDEMLRMVLGKRTEANEARGYILHRNRWCTPESVLNRMVPDLRKQAREREQRRAVTDQTDDHPAGQVPADSEPTVADGDEPQPPSEDAAVVDGEADAGQTTEDAAVTDADAATADSATEVDSSGDKENERTDGGGESAADSSLDEEESTGSRAETTLGTGEGSSGAKSDGIAVFPILLVIVGGLIAVAAILCWPAKERGRYYPGQGGGAIPDPLARFADVPHVIGRFPNRERALSMLAGVSCLSLSSKPGRELSCRLPLEYGLVHDENGTLLGFIAGPAFEYPLWREARDLLHRSRDAEMLSAKPPSSDVRLPRAGPVADAVSELGQFEGDEHDPSCYWLFQANTSEAAKAFLRQVRVNTNGWHVIVQTPQGHWGRDARGLYQE